MKISIVGTGYVGLVTGLCFADLGHTLSFIDIDQEKIQLLKNKKLPIFEKDLDTLLQNNDFVITSDYQKGISDAELIFLCVGTPLLKEKLLDLTFIKEACKNIGQCLHRDQIVVVKSTVVPRTTEEVLIPILQDKSDMSESKDFFVVVNPEFLREGNAVYDFLHPDRIVIGSNGNVIKIKQLYHDFSCPKIFTDLKTAEMIKCASNAFLATKISFINEIGNICKKLEIDVYKVAEGIGYDTRIGRAFLNAGVGWGGSCFPKDVIALIRKAQEVNEKSLILESVVAVNETQPLKVLTLLKKHIPKLKGKVIGILGLSFKPDTDDIRESRSSIIVKELLKEGAHIKAYDPMAMENFRKVFPEITYCPAKEVLSSDAILLLTNWQEFESLKYTEKLVIDGRKIQKAQKDSTYYEGICW